jgi:hypothetical protein
MPSRWLSDRLHDVCFSPEADLVGGVIVSSIGIDAWRHGRGRGDHMLLATLPLILGVHQLVEAFVWWGAEGSVPHALGEVALWVYLLIAFALLPIFVPLAVTALEPTRQRRWRIAPIVVLGAAVSIVLFVAMLRGPVTVVVRPYHLAYSIRLSHGAIIVGCYVAAVCGALLISGFRHVFYFGLANLVAVGVLAWLTIDGFASVWCGYAALSAAAISLHMRYAKPHRHAPYALT